MQMEDTKFYIRVKDKNVGPLSFDEIVSKLKRSELKGDDFIFAVGSPGWVQIKTLMQFSVYIGPDISVDKNTQEVWYIHKNKENLGPFSAERIVSMIKSAEIDIDDYTYRKGISGWTQIKDISEITGLMKEEKPMSSNLEKLSPSEDIKEVSKIVDYKQDVYKEETSPGVSLQKEQPVQEHPVSTPYMVTNRKNIPELIFGILLILVSLLNLATSFIASTLVAFIGVAFVGYYFVRNKKGKNVNA